MSKKETDPTDPLDYIEHEDDEGHRWVTRATRADLKGRIHRLLSEAKTTQVNLSAAYRSRQETQERLARLQRRVDNVEFGRRIGVVLGDGLVRATDARVEVEQDFDDITRFGGGPRLTPGVVYGKATFEFAGDPEALRRLAKFLVTGEVD